MSIKGDFQELYVGKTEANIITFLGKRINIPYDSIYGIEFMLSKSGEIGYLDFKTEQRISYRFTFGKKVNNQILRALELMQEVLPKLEITEHYVDNMEFYKRNWFITLMLFFVMPVGIFLMWYFKKYSTPVRIFLTVTFIVIWLLGIYLVYLNYIWTLQNFNNAINQMYRTVY